MPPLGKAILTVEADPDGDGNTETGEFHFVDVEVTRGLRTGYLVGGRGSTTNAILDSILGDGESRQQGVFLGFGGGTQTYDISLSGWEGASDQWGDTGNGGSATDATGDPRETQIDVLMKYLTTADLDSRNPAQFEYGEHHSGGYYDPVNVVPEQPSFTPPIDESSSFTGQLTLLSAADLTKALDGQKQNPY